jgi:hypothetical protein
MAEEIQVHARGWAFGKISLQKAINRLLIGSLS